RRMLTARHVERGGPAEVGWVWTEHHGRSLSNGRGNWYDSLDGARAARAGGPRDDRSGIPCRAATCARDAPGRVPAERRRARDGPAGSRPAREDAVERAATP